MLAFLRGSNVLSERKARLFGVACCRRIWHLMDDERSQRAIEVAELFADGTASDDQRSAARTSALNATHVGEGLPTAAWAAQRVAARTLNEILWCKPESSEHNGTSGATVDAVATIAYSECWDAQGDNGVDVAQAAAEKAEAVARASELRKQADLLREIFGPVARLTWSGGTVKALANAAYNERNLPAGTLDPSRLAVLADALEEAGVSDSEVLEHLRGEGPHYRGCWALDCVLHKS